ncbi:hypothetical protein [Komagataeibacter saccharivorans]|nr:hypothetical protein [Komagataeibacter saccharivorans]
MPPLFTASFARRLDQKITSLSIAEVTDGKS